MDTAHGQDTAPAAEEDRRPAADQGLHAEPEAQARPDAHGAEPPSAEPDGAGPHSVDVHGAETQDAETHDAEVPPAGSGRRVRRVGVLLAIAAAVYALDVASKAIVVATMHYGQPINLLGPALKLDYTRNPGAAFSIGEAYTIIFTAIAVGVIVVILRLARRLFSVPWAIALGLLLGGALGNLTDRIARAPGLLRGWVVDFIELPHWPIFNLADSAICVGGALMVLLAFRGLHPDGTDERALREAQAQAQARRQQPPGTGPAAPGAVDGTDHTETAGQTDGAGE